MPLAMAIADAIHFVLLNILLIILVVCTVKLEATEHKTWKNHDFQAFRGIRYAEAPIGALRFKDPVRAKTWNNLTAILEQHLDADGSDCPTPNPSNGPYNEDCLYLNVYTKRFNASNLLPVIVFIHPGGLYIGSGSSFQFGAHYLLEEDVVLVTFNYRLAFFGFTSIGPDEPISNAGFKDQALALAWVQDHIHHFGGDKSCVTIMGYSAGALSIALHLVSPMSRHHFHRAFIMSGGILPQEKFPKEQKHLIAKLSKLIGCTPENEDDFSCVNRTDTATITNKLRKIFDFGYDNPMYPWLPILESERIPSEQRFLDRDPFESLRNGDFAKVPILLSVTKDEFGASGMRLMEKQDDLNELLEHFRRVAPICFLYDANDTVSDELYRYYVKHNLVDTKHSFGLYKGLIQSFSDAFVNFPQYRLSQLAQNFTDVYFLKFDYRGAFTNLQCNATLFGDLCEKILADKMVEHTDDLQYIFTSKKRPIFTIDSEEAHVVTKYTRMIAHFARTGLPLIPQISSGSLHASNIKFTGNGYNQTFIQFDGDFHIKKGPFKNAAVWDQLFPKPHD